MFNPNPSRITMENQIESLQSHCEDLTAQRDELLAALKLASRELYTLTTLLDENGSGYQIAFAAETGVNAAIAKVEEGAKSDEPESEQDRDDLIDDGRSDGYGESYAERNA